MNSGSDVFITCDERVGAGRGVDACRRWSAGGGNRRRGEQARFQEFGEGFRGQGFGQGRDGKSRRRPRKRPPRRKRAQASAENSQQPDRAGRLAPDRRLDRRRSCHRLRDLPGVLPHDLAQLGEGSRAVAVETYNALYDICKRAVAAIPLDSAGARDFFEQNFRPVRIVAAGRAAGLLHRLLRADCRRRAAAERRIHRPRSIAVPTTCSPSACVLPARPARLGKRVVKAGRAVLRARGDRGRRDRRARARNLLPEKSDRRLLRRDPGFDPRAARGRLDAAAQLRRPATAIPIPRSANS